MQGQMIEMAPGLYGKIQRGNVVQLAGKRQPVQVMKRSGGTIWVRPWQPGDRIESRPLKNQRDGYSSDANYDHKIEGTKASLHDVTHVMGRPARRRRRYRY